MRIDTFLGSLVGALAIYGIVAACTAGSGARLLADAGLIDAPAPNDGPVPEARANPLDCKQWEFKVIEAPAYNTAFNTGDWEPVGGNLVNSSTGMTEIHLRRCAP
ncbi:MAG: hypothetical protein U0263_30805 [Polyangiaceae bacterium]